MKQLIIIRHAKSDWSSPALKDIDRTLNARGHNDAPIMAKRLLDKKIMIDAFITSPAVRAFTTANYFATAYNKNQNQLLVIDNLYNANVATFYNVVSTINDAFNSVALFSHNPGITEFVNELTTTKIDEMPTCAMFCVSVHATTWQQFYKAHKTFMFFDYPKAV